jgi:hypothetical protein
MSAAVINLAKPGNAENHALASLNTVAIRPVDIEAAMQLLDTIAATDRNNPQIHAAVLRRFMRDTGFADEAIASAALHAIIIAISNWIEAHDPRRDSDAKAVFEAAARFPLSDLPGGIGFDAAGFQEMVLFLEELPW